MRISAKQWFKTMWPTLQWMVNSDYGRDLLGLSKDLPPIVEMGPNYVKCDLGNGQYLTEFRTHNKWAKVINHRWAEFTEMSLWFPNEYSVMPLHARTRGATTDFSPDADTETSTVDGIVEIGNESGWAGAQGGTTGDSVNDSGTELRAQSGKEADGEFRIARAYLYFDTSSIDSGDTISSATLKLYGTSTENGDNDGDDFITIVQVQGNNIGSDTAVAVGDYQYCGDTIDDPTEGIDAGNRLDIGSASTSAYNDFAFNATGIGWIAKSGEQKPSGGTTGITYLGFREGHDVLDNEYAGSDNTKNQFKCSSADETGSSQDPILRVVHAVAGTFKPRVMII